MRELFRFRISIACAAVLLANLMPASMAWAQSEATVRGEVVAAADRSAIERPRVTLSSPATAESWATTADAAGRFVFQMIPPGSYVLRSEAPGFAGRDVALQLEPRDVRAVTLALDVRGVQARVEVTADGATLASTHSPSSTVLRAGDLHDLPLGQRHSLPDAIVVAAPGMIRGHDDFVHVRGHEVALNPMINGVSFRENPHALFSAGLSPAVIDTVNVMTGGFPAEYGNRFGGVLDIVTKSGLRMQNEGSAGLSAGEAGRRSVDAEFGGHRERFGYYAFGSFFESDRYLSPPDREAIHDHGRSGHGFFQMDGNFGGAGALRVVLMGDGSNLELPRHPRDLEMRPLARATQRSRQQSAIAGWTRAWTSSTLSASAYQRWSSAGLSPAAGPLTATAALDRDLLTIGGKADVSRLAGRHTLKAGVDVVRLRPEETLAYDYEGYRALTHVLGWPHVHVAAPARFAGAETGSQVSAYVQDSLPLGTRVTADVGVRLDRYDLAVSATHASPRLNLAVQPGGGVTVHASYNRFFVPPPIEGVLSSNAGLTSLIREIGVALPAIEPTTEDQFELGASRAMGPLRLALTGYYRATENPVHTTVWPDSRIYSYASFDRERAYGLETRIDLPPLLRYGVSGQVNYAIGRVYFYNPVTGGFVTEAGHITDTSRFLAPMDQTHTLTAGATYRHASSGAWVGTLLEYGSGTPMGHSGGDHEHGEGEGDHEHAAPAGTVARVPDHFTANLSAGIDLLRGGQGRGRLTLQIDAENLTNRIYLIAQEGEFSPAQYSIPRLLGARLTVRF